MPVNHQDQAIDRAQLEAFANAMRYRANMSKNYIADAPNFMLARIGSLLQETPELAHCRFCHHRGELPQSAWAIAIAADRQHGVRIGGLTMLLLQYGGIPPVANDGSTVIHRLASSEHSFDRSLLGTVFSAIADVRRRTRLLLGLNILRKTPLECCLERRGQFSEMTAEASGDVIALLRFGSVLYERGTQVFLSQLPGRCDVGMLTLARQYLEFNAILLVECYPDFLQVEGNHLPLQMGSELCSKAGRLFLSTNGGASHPVRRRHYRDALRLVQKIFILARHPGISPQARINRVTALHAGIVDIVGENFVSEIQQLFPHCLFECLQTFTAHEESVSAPAPSP